MKYRIYDAVRTALATCRSWSELDKTITKQGIQIRFRYDTAQGRIIGIAFTINGCTFCGSRIDRAMSYYALDRQLGGRILGAGEQRLSAGSEQYRQRFAELAQSGRLVAPRFEKSNAGVANQQSDAPYTQGDSHTLGDSNSVVCGAGNAANNIGNIIQITVAAFIELSVQPHQVRISSGGGGGSDKGGWNDEGKNQYKPRRRR